MRLSLIIKLLIPVLTVWLIVSSAVAQDNTASTTAQLNVRTAPGTGHSVIVTLEPGTVVIPEGVNTLRDWTLIHSLDGQVRGWVASGYLAGADLAVLPVVEETIPAIEPDNTAEVDIHVDNEPTGVTVTRLNVRSEPQSGDNVLATLVPETTVILEGRDGVGAWVYVHTVDGGVSGWVATRYLSLAPGVVVPHLPQKNAGNNASTTSVTVTGEISEVPPEVLQNAPIVAQATGTARAIYQRGLTLGNHPDRFTRVGDCQAVSGFFMGMFDRGDYNLGSEYAYLQETINHFSGSFQRDSEAVWSGFTIYSVLEPSWSDPEVCLPDETPQECEYRLWKPSFVIISMEVWYGDTATYVANMRQVLDFWIGKGVVPIMATKADNLEGEWSLNLAIYNLSREYDVPLWNFLMATQSLPNQGLTDGFHLSFGACYFEDTESMQTAWAWRNLTALQSLDAVWRGVQ